MWGKHLILDLTRCAPQHIRCPYRITAFAQALVEKIDMVAHGQPWVKHFGSGNKAGYTLVQLIETSNITGHFAEEDNSAYLDVFSCKDFHQKDVEDTVQNFFRPEHIHSRVMIRRPLI